MLTRFRHGVARALGLMVVAGTLAIVHPMPAGAATPTAGPSCSAQSSALPAPGGPAYYLFESNGAVVACGGAPLYGSKAGAKLVTPVVVGAATVAGGGYWVVTARGDVYAFGSASSLGSPARLHLRAPIVAFAPTPDDEGYWIVSAKGNLFHYGDAGFFGSTVREQRDGPVVALVPTPDGKGYWIVSATGVVRAFGDAPALGSLAHRRPAVVAAAANPAGGGLWLLTKDGGVHNLGTSAFFGSVVHRRLPRPLSGLAPTADGSGYLLAVASGSVFNFGDASFEGSLATTPPRRPTGVVALSEVVLPAPAPPPRRPTGVVALSEVVLPAPAPPPVASPVTPGPPVATGPPVTTGSFLPHGQFGFDVSNYQCTSPGSSVASSSLPPSSPFSVIEAAGWLDGADNSCLGAEATWASAAAGSGGAHYSLDLFLNAPDQSASAAALDANGPAGECAALAAASQPACIAYNYGYEGAGAAFAYAASQSVSSSLWWLDVEGTNLSTGNWSDFSAGQYWSASSALNDETIEGAIDALRSDGATVGIYSSSTQFPVIAGSFVPSGAQVPLWVAGTPWTNPPYAESGLDTVSVLSGWCAGTSGYSSQVPTDLFAGGVPWLLQETPGSEAPPYGIDPDYAC